jgi:hypothetical protein
MANTDNKQKLPDFSQKLVGHFFRDDKIKKGKVFHPVWSA